ncbi:MAG: hypothetical protein R2768_17955 [Gordonia sp. (in: high G+C Gram-positive bacteria)]
MTTTVAPEAEVPDQIPDDPKTRQRADARALKDLMRPVAIPLTIGRLMAVVSGVLAVVPYIALVHIGDVLLDAAASNTAVDRGDVNRWIRILVITFSLAW